LIFLVYTHTHRSKVECGREKGGRRMIKKEQLVKQNIKKEFYFLKKTLHKKKTFFFDIKNIPSEFI
jgi:hypothetical protein